MPTKLHYHAEFSSNFGMQYRVEIWHKTTEVTTATEITLGKGGFELKYKNLSKPMGGGILPSSCVLKFMVHNATELAGAHAILTETNQSFFIRIQRTTDTTPNWSTAGLWWGGWVESGFDGYPDAPFPYTVDIKATDSLNRQLNKYNNQTDVASQSDFQDLSYPLQLIEDKFELDTIPPTGASFFQWAWQTNWWNYATGTPPADTNPVRKTYYNRAAFVTQPEDHPLTIQDPNKELKGVLKSFSLRVLMSQGKYWIQQANFLDVSDPVPSVSTAANASGGEVFPSSGILDDMAKEIVIDNANNTPSTPYGGIIKAGSKFTQRNDAHSVRAKYIYGSQFCPISPSTDYTLGLTSLGFLSQGAGANMSLFLNVNLKQTFPMTGAGAVTPISGQGLFMTGVLGCKLKVGNKYLKQASGATSEYQYEWTTVDSVFTVLTGAGTFYDNFDGITTNQDAVLENLGMFGGGYPYPFCSWQNDEPTTNTATATARFFLAGVPLPPLGSTYGEVKFMIDNSASYILYWNTLVPYTNIWLNWYNDEGTGWLNTANPAASSNLDYDIATSTPAVPSTQTISNGLFPYLSDLQVAEELSTAEDAEPIGAQYMASQSGNDLAPDIDLGKLPIGTNSTANQITTIRAKDSAGDFVSPIGFRAGTSGAYSMLGHLLVKEYFKTHSKPQITISGSIISRDYEAHRTIKYEDQIGGASSRWIFCGGKFSPTKDEWAGTWHKLEIDTNPITVDEDDIFVPDTDPDIETGGAGQEATGTTATAGKAAPLAANTETLTTKLGFVLNDLIVATIDEDLTASISINKVDVIGFRSNVLNGQTLLLADKSLRAATLLTVSGDQNAGGTQINFDPVTPSFNYTKGAVIMLRPFDLSNVISAGTATPNLYKGVTETEIYIKAQDFITWNKTGYTAYTRDDLGSVQPSGYASRTEVYASTYVPTGYKVTAVDVYSSQNRTFSTFTARTISDVTTAQGTGTANTTLTLASPWECILGEYFIISYEIGASTDEIYGAKLTIIAV